MFQISIYYVFVDLYFSLPLIGVYASSNKCIGNDTKAAACQSPNCIKKQHNKIKCGEKRFSIWPMGFLHPAVWHDRDINFAMWLHPAMWHLALESRQRIHQVTARCNVIRGTKMTCHWISLVAAPCSCNLTLALGPWHWIRQVAALVAGGSGMTSHWNRPNVRHIGILHLVSSSTISPQSICHSAPDCEILSKSGHPRQKKMTSCRFSRCGSEPSWILGVK